MISRRRHDRRHSWICPQLSRFGWLMELYGENYHHLTRLFAPTELAVGRYLSPQSGRLRLVVDVIECHRYTFFLRMAYNMRDPQTGLLDPSAYVRIYCDARQAEATHCYLGRSMQDVLGCHPAPAVVMHHRLRINTFFGKWLLHLRESGFGDRPLLPLQPTESLPLIDHHLPLRRDTETIHSGGQKSP